MNKKQNLNLTKYYSWHDIKPCVELVRNKAVKTYGSVSFIETMSEVSELFTLLATTPEGESFRYKGAHIEAHAEAYTSVRVYVNGYLVATFRRNGKRSDGKVTLQLKQHRDPLVASVLDQIVTRYWGGVYVPVIGVFVPARLSEVAPGVWRQEFALLREEVFAYNSFNKTHGNEEKNENQFSAHWTTYRPDVIVTLSEYCKQRK